MLEQAELVHSSKYWVGIYPQSVMAMGFFSDMPALTHHSTSGSIWYMHAMMAPIHGITPVPHTYTSTHVLLPYYTNYMPKACAVLMFKAV